LSPLRVATIKSDMRSIYGTDQQHGHRAPLAPTCPAKSPPSRALLLSYSRLLMPSPPRSSGRPEHPRLGRWGHDGVEEDVLVIDGGRYPTWFRWGWTERKGGYDGGRQEEGCHVDLAVDLILNLGENCYWFFSYRREHARVRDVSTGWLLAQERISPDGDMQGEEIGRNAWTAFCVEKTWSSEC
jgi:hypothetical protein